MAGPDSAGERLQENSGPRHRMSGARLLPTSRCPPRFFFASAGRAPTVSRSNGTRRRPKRRDGGLGEVQATQQPDREVEEKRSEPNRVPQVLPLVQDAYAAQGDAMTASAAACARAAALR